MFDDRIKDIKLLIDCLKEFSIEEVLEFEEKHDKQYVALKKLYKHLGNKDLFLKLVLLNAIVSYQLKMKGEHYWETFSEYFSNKSEITLPTDFVKFVELYNNRFIETKKKRIYKLWNAIRSKNLEIFCWDLVKLLKFLSNVMGQKSTAKTLVFAVKMFGYACRITGKRIVFPSNIDIPLDTRIKKVSNDLEFWRKISKQVRIPPLHIDSLIWITLNLSKEDIEKIQNPALKKKISKLNNLLKTFINKDLE